MLLAFLLTCRIMHLELKEALAQFRRWMSLECRVLVTEGKRSWLCRIAQVGRSSVLLSRVDKSTTKITGLENVSFRFVNGAMKIRSDDGSCEFREVKEESPDIAEHPSLLTPNRRNRRRQR